MSKKTSYIKILRMVTGLGLMTLCGYGLYKAYELQVVQNKGATYSLEDDPIRFFMFIGIYIVGVITGPYLIAMGCRSSDS